MDVEDEVGSSIRASTCTVTQCDIRPGTPWRFVVSRCSSRSSQNARRPRRAYRVCLSLVSFPVFIECPIYSLKFTPDIPDGVTMLPTFMPVATQAAIKGLTPEQVESLGVTLILNNTYHLNLRPGLKVLNEVGGAHRFQGWERNLLTVRKYIYDAQCSLLSVLIQDSGGFQLVSLSKFTTITEKGALFASPFTGEPTMLTVSSTTNS